MQNNDEIIASENEEGAGEEVNDEAENQSDGDDDDEDFVVGSGSHNKGKNNKGNGAMKWPAFFCTKGQILHLNFHIYISVSFKSFWISK